MPSTSITTQVHGYQQGHQLLASSAKLAKQDQSIIDRLSDVAGPLRPAEKFDPYLSAYPLPSEQYFVLARTWQDLTVQRAGCVKTLSLIIPMNAWVSSLGLKNFLDLLDPSSLPSEAFAETLSNSEPSLLPPVPEFRASELLEALFLEEAKPVAVFDAPAPELIAVRLLTALWPAMRRRFAMSTFALSPRKIEGRSFDLVFAPKDVRSRFADWGGRRIDARGGPSARHRWTNAIVSRVFDAPSPWLLDERELRLIGTEEADKPAALRIALLWDELSAKIDQSPSAALGLLDIANSRKDGDPATLLALQPILAIAAQRAVSTMPNSEAWDFIGAITRKMHRASSASTLRSVAQATSQLAAQSPEGAIRLLSQPDPQGAIMALVPPIADGISLQFNIDAERALVEADPEIMAILISGGRSLAQAVAKSPRMIAHLAEILPRLSASSFEKLRPSLLPTLVDNTHAKAAGPLIASLDVAGLLGEARLLSEANDFSAGALILLIVERARTLNEIEALRDLLLSFSPSLGRDGFLAETFSAERHDVNALLEDDRLSERFVGDRLAALLRGATAEKFKEIFTDEQLSDRILERLTVDAADILWRAFNEVAMSVAAQLALTTRLLPGSTPDNRISLGSKALARCLRAHFGGDEAATISMLLDVVGGDLDGGWAARQGLDRSLPTDILIRNLVSFHNTSEPARINILQAIDEVARVLSERYTLDLDDLSSHVCAQLFLDSQAVYKRDFLNAAGRILPVLLRSRNAPVSALVAATFPPVYRELMKEDDVPEFLKFIPFVDWDRCKPARRELADAFLGSRSWNPADLALTAYRSGDTWNILRRVAKSYGGKSYLERVLAVLSELPTSCATQVRQIIADIYGD